MPFTFWNKQIQLNKTQLNSILFIEHFQTIRMDQSAVHSS